MGSLVQAVRVWADGAGAFGVFIVAILDSSVTALPNVTDALVMYLSVQRPTLWWLYAAAGTAGTIAGSLPLYLVGRRGGDALLGTRLARGRGARALAWYRRSAFWAVAVPAFLPPPFPLKIFVLLSGVTAMTPWRAMLAVGLGRGVRHGVEAVLASVYRDDAVAAFERYGARGALGVMGAVSLLAAVLWFWPARETSA